MPIPTDFHRDHPHPDVPLGDLSGRTAVVTGSTSGVGRATAHALAGAGAHVVLAVRNPAKGRTVAASLPGSVEVRELDLVDLASVREFATAWSGPIDLLICNAAVVSRDLQRTVDGFELQLGTTHLGHFALTGLLASSLTGRVVTVASQAERGGRLDLDDLNFTRRRYTQGAAYNQAKLANLLFTTELSRRLQGSSVTAHAAHPGIVASAIYSESGPFGRFVLRTVAQSPADGALPVLHAATADVPPGSFSGPRHLLHMLGGAQLIGRSRRSRDPELARRLWVASEELTGVRWDLRVSGR